MRLSEDSPNKEIALKINPDLKAHQDLYSGWWCIQSPNGRQITDWHMFQDSAWKEITVNYDDRINTPFNPA